MTGMASGYRDLDRMTLGFQAGDLIILAARPSMGKSALAMNIAEHALAAHPNKLVLAFSMEMNRHQMFERLVASKGHIPLQLMRSGKLQHEHWSRLSETMDNWIPARLAIDDITNLTPTQLRAIARREARKSKGEVGLIVVDYLQLMAISGNEENRATQISEITRSLKNLAKELKCPVVALSQLNRSVESRNDKRPLMSDLRESGAIEQDADVIMFIYRDDYYTKDKSLDPGVAELIVAKQRNGPTGTVRLAFIKDHVRFEN
jgi:replicative DNA helicase